MVCYLCMDYTLEPLINCKNKLCKAYFHKSCWIKYLQINNLKNTKCKVCYNGKIPLCYNSCNNGEVQMCDCIKFVKNLF